MIGSRLKRFFNFYLPLWLVAVLVMSSVLVVSELASPKVAKAGFSFYRTVTIDHTKVASSTAETYTNFPVMFSSSTLTSLKTTGNGGAVQNSSGYDVGFYTNSDCSTGKMSFQIDNYSATNQASSTWWTSLSSLSTSTNTTLYLCYGDASISTDQGTTATWDSNYKAVWHLPDGVSLSGTDSTSNAVNLTNNSATVTTGQVDGAVAVTSSTGYMSAGSPATTVNDNFTLSGWMKPSTNADLQTGLYIGAAGGFNGWGISTCSNTARACDSVLDWAFDYNNVVFADSGALANSGTWQYVVLVRSNGVSTIYKNGVAGSHTTASTPVAPTANSYVGYNLGAGRGFTGSIDEARVSSVARSADWIKTEYNNQNSPSTFYTIGAENTITPPASGSTPRHQVIIISLIPISKPSWTSLTF